MRPGVAVRPWRSMTRAFLAAALRASALEPTATILAPVMATAWATESLGSTVRIRPLMRTRSWAAAVVTKRKARRRGIGEHYRNGRLRLQRQQAVAPLRGC